MQNITRVTLGFLTVLLLNSSLYGAPFNFGNHDFAFIVNSEGQLVLNKNGGDFDSSLVLSDAHNVNGVDVTFVEGVLQTPNASMVLSGVLNGNIITLPGNGALYAQGTVGQSILVGGSPNKIEGAARFTHDIILQDGDAVLNLGLDKTLNKTIDLQGGTLTLENDIRCADGVVIKSSHHKGTIDCNGYTLSMGSRPFTWSDSIDWSANSHLILNSPVHITKHFTFHGLASINGNGNVLNLAHGSLTIAPAGQLYITDCVLKGVGQHSLNFADVDGKLYLSNVTVELVDNLTFLQGGVVVQGPGTWIVKDNIWTFNGDASLTVDGVTLKKEYAGAVNVGDIAFGTPQENYLTLLGGGIIEDLSAYGLKDVHRGPGQDFLQATTETLQSQIDVLFSIVEALETSTGDLQCQIDDLCSCFCCDCSIAVTGTMYFTLDMLPISGSAVKFEFTECFGDSCELPTLIFDPAVYGNNGIVPLAPQSRIIFTGEGVVEFRNNVHIYPLGTPVCGGDCSWPSFIVEKGATLHLDNKATAFFGGLLPENPANAGAGYIIIRDDARILLDQPSQLVFGVTQFDAFVIETLFASDMTVSNTIVDELIDNPNASQDALITFQQACFDIIFDHQSALNILQGGVVEMNMYRGAYTDPFGNPATGIVEQLYFNEGSVLQVLRRSDEVGLLRVAPNFNFTQVLGDDTPVDFNNKSGAVVGGGFIQFKEFVTTPQVPIKADGTPFALPYQEGGVIAAGTILPVALTIHAIPFPERFQLTANTLLPVGTVLAAGSVIAPSTTPIPAPITLTVNTVFPRGTIIALGSTVAAQTVPAGAITNALLMAPRIGAVGTPGSIPETILPAGTVLATGSERVNTILNIQANLFEQIRPMVQNFMSLSYVTNNIPDAVTVDDSVILVKKGILYPSEDGRLAAICPPYRDNVNRDGSIVGLFENDHNVRYNSSNGNVFDQVIVINAVNQKFTITNNNESTRSR